ncbi:MAG: hypothetical protein ISS88_01860 [Candidatus Portnoybacteria bacterium]|nr:hypothetical protein [Candidatus Portnoybacteria bacterium]
MNIDEEIKTFRKIVNDLLDVKEAATETLIGSLALPKSLFMDAVHMLKRGAFLTEEEILLLAKEFLSVLDEREVEIPEKDRDYFLGKKLRKKKGKKDWKTAEIWRGAYGHEKNQPRDTY